MGKGKKRRREESTGQEEAAIAREGDGATPGEGQQRAPYIFGYTDPSHISESRGFWDRKRKDLCAITEPHEKGMMTGMVTLTQNDRAPELLAHCRRGPCAQPTEREKFEYLLARKEKGVGRPAVQKDPTAAVLSFQRRNLEMKTNFLNP